MLDEDELRDKAESGLRQTLPPIPYPLHLAPCAPHHTSHTLHPTTYTPNPAPYTLHPKPHTPWIAHHTLHLTPQILHPLPCTLYPTLHTLQSKFYTLHSTPYILHPAPYTLHLTLQTPHGQAGTGDFPSIHTLNPEFGTLNPEPYTLNPDPLTPNDRRPNLVRPPPQPCPRRCWVTFPFLRRGGLGRLQEPARGVQWPGLSPTPLRSMMAT